jgi:hypothetical protein
MSIAAFSAVVITAAAVDDPYTKQTLEYIQSMF